MRETKNKVSSRKTGKGQAKPKTRGSSRLGLMKPRDLDAEPVALSRQARQAGKKRRNPGKPRRSAARLPTR